ncbi:hypothetical protein CRE_23585 [Caenorhabditis remanei]|uniref:F-box domain-containing protein n=1 Tax=Caenorhabditis remanei TaxID=31234 RepID=E3MVX3_CAERE|nr:hypothetical protein CRE_23585 [Caenorhabditis remanei]
MSRRPPRKFPLLRLPRLALIEVVKCWNPIEIYLFSRVSRKTKEISKLIEIPDVGLGLTISKCYEVYLGNPARCVSTHWYFRLYPGLRNYEKYKHERYLDIFSKNSGKSVGKLIDHCQEIFKCEFGGMSISNLKFEIIDPVMKSSNLKVFINWLNQHEKLSKIPYLSVSSGEDNLKKDMKF